MRVSVHHRRQVVRGDPYLTLVVMWNALYSLFVFFVAMWVAYDGKLVDRPNRTLDDLDRAWYTAALAVWTFTEPARLYLGVRGNRVMSVSHLVGFLILTLCVHIPVMLLFNTSIPFGNSLDFAVSTIQLMFGFSELLIGTWMLRSLARRNTVEFFVKLGSLDSRGKLADSDDRGSDNGTGSDGNYYSGSDE
jgi:hypothetical protein